MKKFFLYILSLLLFACTHTKKTKQQELLVFCAASLTDVISEVVEQFESDFSTVVHLNFASSGTLARQIEHGAEPSVYISANEKWVDYLISHKIVVPETKKKVAGNVMAVIVPVDSPIDSISFLTDFATSFNGRLAMGDPKHVPAGEYAKQAIENAGYGNMLKNRILPTKDVRSALMVVEMGEVEMGIVYKTDALKSEKVKVVSEIPPNLHSPIGFYASVLKKKNDEKTMLFYKFLSSEEAKTIWIKHAFKFE